MVYSCVTRLRMGYCLHWMASNINAGSDASIKLVVIRIGILLCPLNRTHPANTRVGPPKREALIVPGKELQQ